MKVYVISPYYFDGLQSVTLKLNKRKEDVILPANKIYKNKVVVNPEKDQDILKLDSTFHKNTIGQNHKPANFK